MMVERMKPGPSVMISEQAVNLNIGVRLTIFDIVRLV